MITMEQITAAETVAKNAADELAAVEQEFARGAVSARSHSKLYDARQAADHAALRLALLRKDYEGQETARAGRVAAGEAAARDMAATGRQLKAARGEAVAAVAAAKIAIGEALVMLSKYDTAVREASAGLRARDLRVDDDPATGARLDGGLHLGGEPWLPADGPSLLSRVLAEAVGEVHPRHPMARGALMSFGGPGAGGGSRDLLKRLPKSKRTAA